LAVYIITENIIIENLKLSFRVIGIMAWFEVYNSRKRHCLC